MKRLRTKVVASIVAVLILFCSLPISNVIAVTIPEGGLSVTFKGNKSIDYRLESGETFDSLIGDDDYAKDEYNLTIEKTGNNEEDYKVTFEQGERDSTFSFKVYGSGDVTIDSVTAQYIKTDQWDSLEYITATKLSSLPLSRALRNKNSGAVNEIIVKVNTVNPTYNIYEPSSKEGYEFNPAKNYESMQSDANGVFKFTITSQPGYTKPELTANGESLTASDESNFNLDKENVLSYTIEEITGPVTIRYKSGTGGKQQYNVTLTSKPGYNIYSQGSTTVNYGDSFSFYVVPDNGYKSATVSDILVKNTETTTDANVVKQSLGNNLYQLTGVKENITISLADTATRQTYTIIKPDDVTGYTVSPSNQASWKSNENGSFTFSITADDGYNPPVVKQDGMTINATSDEGNTYTYKLENINQTTTITFTGSKKTYKVTLDDNITGYTLTPASTGNTIVHGDGVYNFYVTTSDLSYKSVTKENIKVKNEEGTDPASGTVTSLGNNQYQLTGVTENVKITLENVEKVTYSITLPLTTEGYDLTVSEPLSEGVSKQNETSYTSEYGKTFKFKIKLDTGYTNSKYTVYVNGEEVAADDENVGADTKQYTISNITENKRISVSGVTQNVYSVRYTSAGTGYTLTTTDTTSNVAYGTELHFTLTVSDGYEASDDLSVTATPNSEVTVTKLTKVNNNSKLYTFTVTVTNNITDFTVTGINAKTYTVTVQNDGKGFTLTDVSMPGKTGIAYNGTYSFKVSANLGYRLLNVAVSTKGGNDLTAISPIGGTYYINNITTDKTITVEVEKVTLTVTYKDLLNSENPETVVTYTVDGVKVNGSDDTTGKYGSVDASSGVVTFPTTAENEYSKYYDFGGWFNGSNKQDETLSLGNADASLTLTAKWTPDWSKIFTLKWDPNANQISDKKLTVKYTPGEKNIVPALDGAKITKVGMYYAQDQSKLSQEQLEVLKKEFIDAPDKIKDSRSVRQIIPSNDKSVILYVYVTDYTDINAWTSFEQSFTGVTTDRYAVGWIELTLNDGSKQYIYTELKTITANQ